MFKNKVYLYGLGTGLVITAILMQLIYQAESYKVKQPSPLNTVEDANPSDDDHQIQYIESLPANDQEWDEFLQEHIAEISKAAARLELDLNPSTVNQPEEEQTKETEVILTIVKGMGSNQVAEQLYQLNLIDHIDDFLALMEEDELNTKIQIGTFRFTEKPEMEQIIERITSLQR